ncbi:hypothetical protein [Burkholderia sp. Ac-20365]|uniref:hypothetical protein n=1 Tax=Burkholderia sp. Ac-20365 TaxID=2703897 RepID=UPI00197B82EA|nr:hypothetical protein [Burkholderia sp. Ac-20365]MBN3760265.1 hypothetical protein [Burkholderia sp. Ac-20365]
MSQFEALAAGIEKNVAAKGTGPLEARGQEEELAVLAAFFCLLFFAAAKKSRCRPAQGRRVKYEDISRTPAQSQANQTSVATQPKNP